MVEHTQKQAQQDEQDALPVRLLATDPTSLSAWGVLKIHFAELQSSGFTLKQAFARDARRAKDLSFMLNDIYVDLSKNLITQKTLEHLLELARQLELEKRRDAQFSGEKINATEKRSVLHTALRSPKSQTGTLVVDGQDVVKDVHETLERVYAFAREVRSGAWKGVSGKPIKTVVNIGIGGSDLGPAMVYEALKVYADAGITARFVSNIDPNDLAEKTRDLDPETTLFIVVSKTFTTLETLTNAESAKEWLIGKLRVKGVIPYTQAATQESIAKHFAAVSTALTKVSEFGIDPQHTFGFWNWVGGRYSVDSAVGTILAVVLGPERFEEFLRGMHAVDEHFLHAPLEQNVPMLMGLLNIWYVNFWGATTHAVLPYNQYLSRFPAYLQQLTMESNGKSVRLDGTPLTYRTGEVFWGEPGTNGQHAFYQLLHQGTTLIPADFIAFVNTAHPHKESGKDVQELLLGNFLAQTKALAFGKTRTEVIAEGTPESLVSSRVFVGNRPTTSLFAPSLTPYTLGELIALYEHITFVEGSVWGLNPYDQWGVELGKQLAQQITPALSQDDEALAQQDASTKALIAYYRKNRVQ